MVFAKKNRSRIAVLIIALIMITVFPVDTVANDAGVKYRFVRIFSVNPTNRTVRAETLLELSSPDPGSVNRDKIYSIESTGVFVELTVSRECPIYIGSAQGTLSDIKPESLMVVTMEDNIVTRMVSVDGLLLQEAGIYNGILEENNTGLGYITLYFPDGSGTSPGLRNALSYYRTYSYLRADEVEVYKNGEPADIEDLKPGDSVFVKVNGEGTVVKISATDNFYPVYGRVRTKGNWLLQLETTSGDVVQYRIPSNTPIFIDKKKAQWSDIKEGDEVRILIQTSGNQTIIGEIVAKKKETEIDAVYRAKFYSYDKLSNSILVHNIQQFKDGIWEMPGYGFSKLNINENYVPGIPKGMNGSTVYIATGKNITGKESVVCLAFADDELKAEISGDTIVDVDPGRGRLSLLNKSSYINYDNSSIIVKNGKLLSPNQIKIMDDAYFVTGVQSDGTVRANVIWVKEQLLDTGVTLLRGRIAQIDLLSSMTLESFSEFREPDWEYNNVRKTLTIDPMLTRVFDDDGRIDLTLFDDAGEKSYKKRTVYVLAQEGKALLVSTAPFGDVVYKGRIYDLPGLKKDAFNHVVTPATSLVIRDGIRYNDSQAKWEEVSEVQFSFLPNTVFMKNGKIIDASQLETGDRITVIKSETGENAFVVIVDTF
ncbi:S-layer domain protein [Thermoclostridium stercorarium subsp. stercorarium DSM 8532]|uniref:S-layer domain protein n=2 Tax=Thermoclostridium stercorarium TaxID=1510 RepID=L7VJF0_THES1|nr:S-layer domain protein [Thermoclostridium stercorarium]AGC68195.1 S-layer domain protein [Thermoclostridium stercorarium subsp. stercorarium DSM 8532]AGI39223.1 hypothetical protein Clst_1156 [Thermoclostridium stercorarium subsp. stercorarium DSM 8532]ANW98567.1 S-layer protein [Thermoclostridium stercorarium subsp. thermolacticum DSM 2910]UZQ86722.1 S-layer protein [Thermoclostridium stercorarium]